MAGIFGGNPYVYPQMYQQQESNMLFVNGIQEALGWAVQPGKTAYLFDRNEDVFYVKTMDRLEIFDYKRREDQKDPVFNPEAYVTKESFDELQASMKKMEKRLDDMTRHRKGRGYEQLSLQDVREQ